MHKARGFKRDSQATRAFNPELKHIGYHYLIELDGTTRTGRHMEEVGAHVQGNNSKSLGICMVGMHKFSEDQWIALRVLLLSLAEQISGRSTTGDINKALTIFKDLGISIKGHRDYSPDLNGDGQITRNEWIKECPTFDVSKWIKGGMMPMQEHLL